MTDHARLVDRLLDALSRYDADALEELVDPDLVHWVNLTEEEQGLEGLLATLRLEAAHVAKATFTRRHVVTTDHGFVLQLTADGVTHGGAEYHIPVCLVVAADGDRITRIDEYANVDHVKPLLRELFGSTR